MPPIVSASSLNVYENVTEITGKHNLNNAQRQFVYDFKTYIDYAPIVFFCFKLCIK